MSTTPTSLARGTFTTTSGTILYTSFNTGLTSLDNVIIANPASGISSFNIGIQNNGITYPLFATRIASNSTLFYNIKQVLTSGQSIVGNGSLVGITYHLSGVVVN